MVAHGFALEHLRHVDAHKLLEHLGDFSMYEMTNFCIVQTLNFYYAASMFVMSFIEKDPHLLCIPHNESIKVMEDQCSLKVNGGIERCDYSDKATLYVVNNGPVQSIFPSLGLLCSTGLAKEFGMTFFTIGAFTMVPFISAAADYYGRKTVVLICLSVSCFANALVYVVENAYMFWALRFIIGAASDGYLTIAGIQTTELVAQDVRDWYGLVYNIYWSGGLLYTSLLSLIVSDWRMFYLSACLPAMFVFPLYALWLPETPHWLCEHRKLHQLGNYIAASEQYSGQKIDMGQCLKSEERKLRQRNTQSPLVQIYKALKSNRTFMLQMMINGYIQFVIAMFYFTVTIESTKLTDDGFIGFALSAGIELPGGILTLPAVKFFGRKTLVWSMLCLQGLFIALYPFMPYPWLAISFNLISKIFNGIVYSTHPLLLTEMIPTGMRTAMYSLVNIPQSFGIIVAPYLKYLQFGTTYIMYIIIAVTSVIGGLMALALPETKGRRLPEELNDMANDLRESASDIDLNKDNA